MRLLKFLFVVLTICAVPVALWAQANTGAISGIVTDPNGAVIPEVTVVATQVNTGLKFTTKTTGAGLYAFPSLPTGPYSVTAEKEGFKKFVQSGVDIRLGMQGTINIKMELGTVQQTVEVVGQAPVIDTSNTVMSTGLSPRTMQTLPLWNGGLETANSFVGWMPGVNTWNEVSINGSIGRASEITIDGASLVNPESGGVTFVFPGFYAYSEMRLVTTGFNAEYGRVGGGIQEFVSKSGTNAFHGELTFNWKRDNFDAVPWATNASTTLPRIDGKAIRPKEFFNEYAGDGGGPVYIPHVYDGRDKTFWYFSYAQIYQPASYATNASESVPTLQMRNGNFNQWTGCNANTPCIYNPYNEVNGVRQPFGSPGAYNIIPTTQFSAISKNILPYIPEPNIGSPDAVTNNYTYNSYSKVDDKVYSIKVDHNISERNHATFFMVHRVQDVGSDQYFPGPLSNGLEQFQSPYDFRATDDFVVNPRVLIHTVWGLRKDRQYWLNPLQDGFGTTFGFPLAAGTPQNATPIIAFRDGLTMLSGGYNSGYTSWGMNQGKVNNGGQWNTTIMVAQDISWIHNKHEFKMGWDFRRMKTDGNDWAGTNGVYNFSQAQTSSLAGANDGNAFASFLLGAVYSGNANALPVFLPKIRYQYQAGYIQDTWKVKPTLTLNLGFRYEVPIGWYQLDGNMSTFSPTTPNPGADNLPGAFIFMGSGPGRTGALRPYPTDYHDFGPRLGFAWNVKPTWVVRGFWGITYEALGNGGCGCTDGFGGGSYAQVSDGFNPAFNWDPGSYNPNAPVNNPGGVQPPASFHPAQQIPTIDNFATNVWYVGPNFGKAPRIFMWNFDVQKQLKGWLIDVGYVGNRGHGLNSSPYINQVPATDLYLGAVPTDHGVENLLQANIGSPNPTPQTLQLRQDICTYTKAIPCANGVPVIPFSSFATWGGNATLAQALRPYPMYQNIYSSNSGDGMSWYDSMQIKAEHRFGDLNFMTGFVWSKTQALLSFRQIFTQTTQQGAQNAYNLKDAKSLMLMDVPYYLNIVMSYRLPFGEGKRFLGSAHGFLEQVAGGWTVAYDGQYRSGNLLQVANPNNYLNSELGATLTKATPTGMPIRTGVSATDLDPNNPNIYWFNHGANAPYSITPAFTLGTASIYNTEFRNPWYRWEAVSINKDFKIHESLVFNYNVNMWNPFNRTDFGNIQSNLAAANFGRAQSAMVGPRAITMGVRLMF